jgi:hypothetical protein
MLTLKHLSHQEIVDILKLFDKVKKLKKQIEIDIFQDKDDKITVEEMAMTLEWLYQERKSIVNERKSRRLYDLFKGKLILSLDLSMYQTLF